MTQKLYQSGNHHYKNKFKDRHREHIADTVPQIFFNRPLLVFTPVGWPVIRIKFVPSQGVLSKINRLINKGLQF